MSSKTFPSRSLDLTLWSISLTMAHGQSFTAEQHGDQNYFGERWAYLLDLSCG